MIFEWIPFDFLHHGSSISFKYLSVSTYFYRMNPVLKDWRHLLAILALNITILTFKSAVL